MNKRNINYPLQQFDRYYNPFISIKKYNRTQEIFTIIFCLSFMIIIIIVDETFFVIFIRNNPLLF